MSRAGRHLGALTGLALALGGAGCGDDAPSSSQPPLQPSREVGLPRIDKSHVVAVATDGDLPTDSEPVWVVESSGPREVQVSRVSSSRQRRAGKGRPVRDVELRASAPRDDLRTATQRSVTRFDVARWDPGTGTEQLFVIRITRQGLAVAVRTPGRDGLPLASGTASVAPTPRGTHRDVAVATWSGSRPDLFVVDRGRADQRIEVTIFSGESSFRSPIVRLRTIARGADPRYWDVDVARVTQPQPDLVLTARGRGRPHAEVHVLSGEDSFQRFAYRRQLNLPSDIPGDELLLAGSAQASEALFAFDLSRSPGSLTAFPLFEDPNSAL